MDIEEFAQVYCARAPMCLFTGAGVSYTEDARFRAPGWRRLLGDVFCELLGQDRRAEAEARFAQLTREHPQLWRLASAIKDIALDELRRNEDDFVAALRKAVLRENETLDSKKRLKVGHLRGASTLNAVIAFCSEVTRLRVHPCFGVNPRVKAVLTANYDWFLEAGATTKHQASLFKPMARPTSSLPAGRLPVYHIHGYLPYEQTDQPTQPLILDYAAYERAYHSQSWTRDILAAFIAHYPTLFVGFSFEDEYLLAELRRHARRGAPPHYALLREADERPPGLLDEIRGAGVRPLLYKEHNQIPDLLGQVYQAALPQEVAILSEAHPAQRHFKPPVIWDMLLRDKRSKLSGRAS